jgi:hypothetical protein
MLANRDSAKSWASNLEHTRGSCRSNLILTKAARRLTRLKSYPQAHEVGTALVAVARSVAESAKAAGGRRFGIIHAMFHRLQRTQVGE